jgi:hypothetical protein
MSALSSSGNTLTPTHIPYLRLEIVDEFGNRTEVVKTLNDSGFDAVYWALRDALMGCGYDKGTVDEWMPWE